MGNESPTIWITDCFSHFSRGKNTNDSLVSASQMEDVLFFSPYVMINCLSLGFGLKVT